MARIVMSVAEVLRAAEHLDTLVELMIDHCVVGSTVASCEAKKVDQDCSAGE
ncbi:MAG: hypothetical protein KatS3mg014_1246 [Actinomycetota bacterium]|nr:MAG: hypothetical protein KatS3mg014_1246 [Actinomycetota bacterium]